MINESPDMNLAQPWLEKIARAEKKLDAWQSAADSIDRRYANLAELRSNVRDRQFSLFWSNIQVMLPAIYARPPIPVVTPKFKDRRALYRTASEFLERVCSVGFDMARIDEAMLHLRDDLVISGRGACWVRYEDEDGERICIEHLDRKDFVHDPARKWSEVDWVARRGWLTQAEMRKRFGDAADDVSYGSRPDDRKVGDAHTEKCGVWEIWCRSENTVVWVADGLERVLDRSQPHLKISGFFPCPEPIYADVERRSLVPVPDMLQYKDQLEEVDDLTRRIHALADAVRVRGFYSGAGDVAEAVERAMKMADDGSVLIPVPNLDSLTAGGSREPIIWMPLEKIAQTITGLIELRRQIIDDVYQIIGLSDIMRGATEASETLGAQQLKQQNGSYRIRDKQQQMTRCARDLVRISAEIMSEEFGRDTMIDMAQMDLPTDADIAKHVAALKQRMEDDTAALEQQAQQAQDPQQAQQQMQAVAGQYAAQIKQVSETVTVDQVMDFLRDEKLRPFVLDIETDSTVYADEAAEKASRAEFMSAFSASMASLQPMFSLGPEAIAVAGAVFKFSLAPYRVGRELEGLIDDFIDQGPQIAQRLQEQESKGDDQGLAAANMKLAEAEVQKAQAAIAKVQADTQKSQMDMQLRQAEAQAKAHADQQRIALEFDQTRGNIAETEARIRKVEAEIAKMGVDASNQTRQQDREDVKTVADIESRQVDQAMSVQDRQRQAVDSDRAEARANRGEDRADRQQDFAERQGPNV